MENPHTNCDPVTGGCMDCGATREEIDDNIWSICEKVEGPHRLAIIILNRYASGQESAVAYDRKQLDLMDRQRAWLLREIETLTSEAREVRGTLDLLRRESGMDTERRLSVAEAIRRL